MLTVGIYLTESPPEIGGGHTFEHEVLAALERHAHETAHRLVIFTSASQPTPPNGSSIRVVAGTPRRSGFVRRCAGRIARKVYSGLRRTSWRNPALADRQWQNLLRRHGVDVLFSPGPLVPTQEIPYVVTVWDLQHRLQPFFPELNVAGEWQARESYYGESLRRAAAVITGTEVGRGELERFYQVPRKRISILPHPTPRFALEPPDLDFDGIRHRFGLKPGYLFYPAQFWPHKNHVGALRTIRALNDLHGLRLPLVLAGSDQGNLSHVRSVARDMGLDDQVFFLGFVSRDELIALYRGALALLYLSFCGPENLPPLEAFALGCPVVAADVAGAREQLEDAALLVDPRNPNAIAAEIQRLHGDAALRARLIERGRTRAVRYTGTDFIRGVFRILDELEPVCACWGYEAAS